MKKISFITIHPAFISSYLNFGVFSSAIKRCGMDVEVIDLRDFAIDKRGSVDDRAYGGGDGMIMRPEPLVSAVKSIRTEASRIIFPGPAGRPWNQKIAGKLSKTLDHAIFICGRFGGVDQRVIELLVDYEFSLGDFVISGGELASLTMADCILRLIPGVLGNRQSSITDSFSSDLNGMLEYPQYTRPPCYEGLSVPEALISGDHATIESWKKAASLQLTRFRRPDLIDSKDK